MAARGVEFDAKNIVGEFGNLREMFAVSGARTVPVVVVEGEVLVGFDKVKLDELLTRHGL